MKRFNHRQYLQQEKVLLWSCRAGWEAGKFCVRRRALGRRATLLAEDFRLPTDWPLTGAYLEKAWAILRPEIPGDWKTVGLLRTLRQALREHVAQNMPLTFPPREASRLQVCGYLAEARKFDAVHHGSATF